MIVVLFQELEKTYSEIRSTQTAGICSSGEESTQQPGSQDGEEGKETASKEDAEAREVIEAFVSMSFAQVHAHLEMERSHKSQTVAQKEISNESQ